MKIRCQSFVHASIANVYSQMGHFPLMKFHSSSLALQKTWQGHNAAVIESPPTDINEIVLI